jgi:hypothetical protein
MRLPALVFALCLAAMVAFGAVITSQPTPGSVAPRHGATVVVSTYDSSRMWRRAEIRVVTLEQADRNRVALESLRQRVALAEQENTNVWLLESNVRQQLFSQAQLIRELLALAEQQQSNRGQTPNAMAVEHRLNQLQGQIMCEACHSGIVAHDNGFNLPVSR